MRLDLLDLVTSATRKDILWLIKGARAPSYKIVAPSSTSKPAQGQGQGCHRWRSLAFRQKPVQSTCNPANSAKSAPTRPPSRLVRTGAPAAGAAPPTPPPLCPCPGVTSPCPPAPRHRGGRAPGTRIGPGAAPEPPKTPLGLLGLVVVAGGSRTACYWAPCPSDTRVRAAWPAAVRDCRYFVVPGLVRTSVVVRVR